MYAHLRGSEIGSEKWNFEVFLPYIPIHTTEISINLKKFCKNIWSVPKTYSHLGQKFENNANQISEFFDNVQQRPVSIGQRKNDTLDCESKIITRLWHAKALRA